MYVIGKKREFLCPHCRETCSTNWNLKIHIERKHTGKAEPIQPGRYTTNTQPIPDMSNKPRNDSFYYNPGNNYSYHQTYPSYGYFSELNSNKLEKSQDSKKSEKIKTLLQMAEIIHIVKQIQPTSSQPFVPEGIPQLSSGINLPPLSPDLLNLYNLMQYMFSNNVKIIGFQGHICYDCFSYWADLVFNEKGDEKPFLHFKPTHNCDPKKVEHALYDLDIQNKKNHLYGEFINFMLMIANAWILAALFTQRTIYLKAEELVPSASQFNLAEGKDDSKVQSVINNKDPSLSTQEEQHIDLTNIRENHWAYRAIKEEHEKSIVINHDELIDFVKTTKGTFGLFQIKTADASKHYFSVYLVF